MTQPSRYAEELAGTGVESSYESKGNRLILRTTAPIFFGNHLGQSFQTENGKLAIFPSGVAGTTGLLIEARDAQTGIPAASRALNVTVNALPFAVCLGSGLRVTGSFAVGGVRQATLRFW